MFSKLRNLVDFWLPGPSRLYRRLRDRLVYRSFRLEPTSFGFALWGEPGLDACRVASEEAAVFVRLANWADVVIDVGANVGFYTLLAAKQGKPVLAIEPQANNLALLLRNLELNGADGVEVFPLALSDRPGVCRLFGSRQAASLISGWGGARSNYSVACAVNTLDNLIAHRFAGSKLLIKIDVEGNEYNVLRGAARLLERTPPPAWLIEHGLTENFEGINPNFEPLFQLFWNAGYVAFTADNRKRPVTPTDVARWVTSAKRDFGGIEFVFEKNLSL